jgi:hypothetical protein
MGVCLSCTDPSTPPEEVQEVLIQPEQYTYIIAKQTPTITPQTPSERGLSKIVSQRPSKRRASILQPVETTPLLSSEYIANDELNVSPRSPEIREIRNEPQSPEYYDPFPDIKIETFYRYSREMSSHQAKNLFWLRSYWETVSSSLKPGPWTEQSDSFLSLRSLYDIFKSETPLEILPYLAGLIADDQILKQVADQYLLPLL